MRLQIKQSSCKPISKYFICWLVFLTIAKLVLCSREEMRGTYSPHDDLWQVWAAQRWYWGGTYATNFLYHLPIYPLFIKIVSITGIPLRIGMELLYCFGCSLLSITLCRIGIPQLVGGVLSLAAIFNPSSFQLPNRFGAEILLASLLLLALSQSLEWWIARKTFDAIKPAVLAAIFWALAWNSRKEAIVLLPIFIILALCVIAVDKADTRQLVCKRIGVGVILPLCACLALTLTICSINYIRWGLFSTSILSAPGYKMAFKALQSIKPDREIAYIPVTVKARQAAYKESSSFALLQEQLEGPVGRGWAGCSKPWTDSKGLTALDPLEISAGWFYWALYESAARAGYASTPAQGDAFFKKIGKEIRSALIQGKLPKRFVPIAMIDPNFSCWLPKYRDSLKSVYNTFLTSSLPVRNKSDQPMLGDDVKKEFDDIANRRSRSFPNKSSYNIDGWILTPGRKIIFIAIADSSGKIIASLSPTEPRNDVSPQARAFVFHIPLSTQDTLLENQIIVSTDDGEHITWQVKELIVGKVNQKVLKGKDAYLACDRFDQPKALVYWSWNFQDWFERIYYQIIGCAQWLALLGLFMGVFLRRNSSLVVVIFLLSTAVITRILLFAMLDASAWNGAQPRYLFPVMPEFSMLVVLGCWVFFHESLNFLNRIHRSATCNED
ncbi:MAG: hypothetical protein FJ390_01170 [Verrucomicrobia bacterium]|nr:hypothetical protein [Verrucomicrobiota bacterium]